MASCPKQNEQQRSGRKPFFRRLAVTHISRMTSCLKQLRDSKQDWRWSSSRPTGTHQVKTSSAFENCTASQHNFYQPTNEVLSTPTKNPKPSSNGKPKLKLMFLPEDATTQPTLKVWASCHSYKLANSILLKRKEKQMKEQEKIIEIKDRQNLYRKWSWKLDAFQNCTLDNKH